MSWVNSVTTATSGIGGNDARSFMDGSGWTVSTGASKAIGGARTQTESPFDAAVATMAEPGSLAPWAIAAAVALVLVLVMKKRA